MPFEALRAGETLRPVDRQGRAVRGRDCDRQETEEKELLHAGGTPLKGQNCWTKEGEGWGDEGEPGDDSMEQGAGHRLVTSSERAPLNTPE